MKRALRVDKMRLAMLEATLRLYRDPDRLAQRLPTAAAAGAAEGGNRRAGAAARRAAVARRWASAFTVEPVDCASQIGSGALPIETVPSAGLAIRPKAYAPRRPRARARSRPRCAGFRSR